MRGILLWVLVFFISPIQAALSDIGGTADNGRRVILRDDGSWAYLGAAAPTGPASGTLVSSPGMTTVLTSGAGWKAIPWAQAPDNWAVPTFDDSAWPNVAAPWSNPPSATSDIIGMGNTVADWIWETTGADEAVFRYRFDLADMPSRAWLRITADNAYTLFVNGQFVGEDTADTIGTWRGSEGYAIDRYLVRGENVIGVIGQNYAGPSGLLVDLTLDDLAVGGTTATGGTSGPGTTGTGAGTGAGSGASGPILVASPGTLTSFGTGAGWKALPRDQVPVDWAAPLFDTSGWQDAVAPWPNAPVAPQAINGMGDTNAQWIWQRDDVDQAFFAWKFTLADLPQDVWVRITADNAYVLYVNDLRIASDTGDQVSVWQNAERISILPYLFRGTNVIWVKAQDYGQNSGLLADVTFSGLKLGAAGTPAGNATGTMPGQPTLGGNKGNSGATGSTGSTGSTVPTPPAASGPQVVTDLVNLQDVDVYQYSYRNWDNANWAKWTSLTLSSHVDGIAGTDRRIYFSFDAQPLAAAVKAGGRVLLQLNSTETSTGTSDIELFRVVTPWQPGSGTYHSGQDEPDAPPGVISWNNQPVIDFSRSWASVSMSPGVHSLPFDITDLVRGWLRGDFPNYGLVLVGADEGSGSYSYVFDSTETPRVGAGPQVIVIPGSAQVGAPPPVSTPISQPPQPTGNLVVNGSFEDAPIANNVTSGIAGWSVVVDNVDVVGDWWQQIDGSKSLDLAGTYGSGAIGQDVPTQPGATYEVSFMVAGNPVCDSPRKQMRVTAAGQFQDFAFDTSGHSQADMGWTARSWQFTAIDRTTRLTFESIGPNTGCGMALDAVEVHRL